MIVGDHDDAEAGLPGLADSGRNVLPRRVLEAYQADENQIIERIDVRVRSVLESAGDNTEPLVPEPLDPIVPSAQPPPAGLYPVRRGSVSLWRELLLALP